MTIKWQSQAYPKLILTEEDYGFLRMRLRYVESFRDEMEKAETWLFAHPDRHPKKDWRRFVLNWLRKANEIAYERVGANYERKSRERWKAETVIAPLTEKMQVNKPVVDPYHCQKCGKKHSPKFRCGG
jgi:hypothetical protein